MFITEGQHITIENKKCPSKPMELKIDGCLRSVPGRRAVYEGLWEDHSVIIKVFLSRVQGWRHFVRELKGLNRLADRCIPTATVLGYGRDANGNRLLVLEKIENSEVLSSICADPGDLEIQTKPLSLTLSLLAQMHVAGVLQRDLHLGNFLWDGGSVYALDPAQMQFFSKSISERKSLRQLGTLMTAFMSYGDDVKKELLAAYFQERGWKLDAPALDRITRLAQTSSRRAIKRTLKKSLRTCTDFIRHENLQYTGVFDRGIFEHHDMAEFMAGLDKAMEAGEILKRGNTCFVSRIRVFGRDVVVKRYNHKGLWHSLRHTLKGSRAKKCWLFGHRLKCLDIPVSKPLAFIELRHCGIIRQSYILNDFIEGRNIRDYVNQPDLDERARQQIRNKAAALLSKIVEHRITHGDLKATNILICDDQPVLIDLDSMKYHRCRWLLKVSQQKMKNKIQEQNL
jgi:tRNA A-37 threonylcarbamoyl transferase component Bud32